MCSVRPGETEQNPCFTAKPTGDPAVSKTDAAPAPRCLLSEARGSDNKDVDALLRVSNSQAGGAGDTLATQGPSTGCRGH